MNYYTLFRQCYLAPLTALAFVLLTSQGATGQTGTLPTMFIETENHLPVTSKEYYLPGTYYIVDETNPEICVGSADAPEPLEIRGRGHSSWKGQKKPYKIKLGEKTPLLGMKKNKHWALLKFYEPTVAGMQLGNIMGMDWTPTTKPIEVVLNDVYLGIYLLTETNRIDKNRLNIYEQPNWNTDDSSIPYGWLVEVDNYYENNQIVVRENNNWDLRITYHSPDSLSQPQRQWLLNEFRNITDAIYDPDKGSGEWEQMIDVDAMARYFIIQEVLDNSDGFHGSFYLHKDRDDAARWVAGPLWDLACNQREKTDYTFIMPTSYGFTPHWIGELIKDDEFCDAVRQAWKDFYPSQVQPWMDYIDEHLQPCSEAFEQEKILWNYTNPATLYERTEALKVALLANIEWFNNHLPGSVTTLNEVNSSDRTAVKVEYVNMSGMRSSKPWMGMNIKIITFNDGSTSTTKMIAGE